MNTLKKHGVVGFLGILGIGTIAFGADIIINPIPDKNPDQAIYDTIKNAEVAGTVPQFTIDDTSDLTKISAQYIKVAKDNGVNTAAANPSQPNLYLATRAAMQANGVVVTPVAADEEAPLTP